MAAMRLLLAALAAAVMLLAGPAQACISGTCSQNMCSDIPSDNVYGLTSFCDSEVACGSWSGDCYDWFCADYKRFGCGSIISCCQGRDCVNLQVIDGGPACYVEDDAGIQIVDASYSTCQHFTGSTSCGWSDGVRVTCVKTSYTVEDLAPKDYEGTDASVAGGRVALGPCTYDAAFAAENDRPMCTPDGKQ